MKPRNALCVILLACSVSMMACSDDANGPPPLTQEALVGCWVNYYSVARGQACMERCFDPNASEFVKYHFPRDPYSTTADTTTEFLYRHYRLDGDRIRIDSFQIGNPGRPLFRGFDPGSERMGVENGVLTVYQDGGGGGNIVMSRVPVTSDPCGKPFELIPKPTDWVLF